MSIGKLFIVSAPSGAGKTSLVDALIKELSLVIPLKKAVTYTTRSPRPGEINGVDYYFLSRPDFERKINESFFIEFSMAYGHYYGSSKEVIHNVNCGASYLMILDKEGALQVRSVFKDACLIWIYTSDIESLKSRLLLRGSEEQLEIEKRLKLACEELADFGSLDLFAYKVLNDEFDKALSCLKQIVVRELCNIGKK